MLSPLEIRHGYVAALARQKYQTSRLVATRKKEELTIGGKRHLGTLLSTVLFLVLLVVNLVLSAHNAVDLRNDAARLYVDRTLSMMHTDRHEHVE